MNKDIFTIEQEKKDFYKFETDVQKILDRWYIKRNHTVDRTGACKEFDCILDNDIKVEEKIRDGLFNDILIEIIQDLITFAPGWAITTKSDYIHYVMCFNKFPLRLYRINWKKFRPWYFDIYLKNNKQGRYIISQRGWGLTLNMLVPINDIEESCIVEYKLGDVNE